jgi:predicted nucleic acid-binding protein
MTVVSDTSPITNLMQVGQLDLLPALFDEIVIPESVFEELNRLPEQQAALQHSTWLSVAKAQNLQGQFKFVCGGAAFSG